MLPSSMSERPETKRHALLMGAARPFARTSEPSMLDKLSWLRSADFDPDTRAEVIAALPRGDAAALAVIDRRCRVLNSELAHANGEIVEHERWRDALDELVAWGESKRPWRLEAVNASILHKMYERPFRMLSGMGEAPAEAKDEYTVFLLQHDWARLLRGTDAETGEFRLPFDRLCLELSLSGRRVCALWVAQDGDPQACMIYLQTSAGWLCAAIYRAPDWDSADGLAEAFAVIRDQTRAIAIMLDAEVVTAHVTRADDRLNASRVKADRPPLYDHHTLRLVRRAPIALAPAAGLPPHRKRLHFRRGHWRHYPAFKTWIRWCLVGDPALGFADKDYRL